MARLTLTNNREMHLWVLERDKKAGFADYDTADFGGVFLAVHRKTRNPIENFLKLPNGDVVASAGTLIYKDLLGAKALERLYDDFDGDIDGLRKNAMGNYFVAVKKGRAMVLFVDKYESLHTYYHDDGKNWIVGNSLSAVAEAVCRKDKGLTVNELALMETAFVDAVIGKNTIFDNIYKLTGTEYISTDPQAGTMGMTALPYKRLITDAADRTVDKMAARYAHLLRTKLDTLRNLFGDSISIHATGGMDNRLLLAGLLSCGAKPSLAHGVGTNEPGDLAVVRMFAAKFGLELHEVEWPPYHDAPTSRYDELFQKHGFNAAMALCRDFFDGFEEGPLAAAKLTLSGYYGELIRQPARLDVFLHWRGCFAEHPFSLDQFMGYLLAGFNKLAAPAMCMPYEAMYSYLRNKIEECASRYGVERENDLYSAGSFQMVFDPWMRASVSRWDNITNRFTGSVSLPNCDDLHELAFEVPMAWRNNNHFALKAMQLLWPPMLDVPVFSHGRAIVLDKKSLELRPPWRSQLVQRAVSFLEGSRTGRRVHKLLKPLHLGSWLTMWQQPLRCNQRGGSATARDADADALATAREIAAFRARVDAEQQSQGLRLIDLNAFPDDLFRLARYWKWLYYIRKIREAAAAK